VSKQTQAKPAKKHAKPRKPIDSNYSFYLDLLLLLLVVALQEVESIDLYDNE
jgi:hypothetical protein